MTEWDYTHSNINLKINQNKMTAVIDFFISALLLFMMVVNIFIILTFKSE